jgi:very-short-patch-repair endonuclease
MYEYNRSLKENTKYLRINMTPEEKHLWYDFLKKLPVTVKRQKNIGNYIVDFYIAKGKIVIEIDGSQHFLPDGKIQDAERNKFLQDYGITVLRYKNRDVNENFEAVAGDILKHLNLTFDNLKS